MLFPSSVIQVIIIIINVFQFTNYIVSSNCSSLSSLLWFAIVNFVGLFDQMASNRDLNVFTFSASTTFVGSVFHVLATRK